MARACNKPQQHDIMVGNVNLWFFSFNISLWWGCASTDHWRNIFRICSSYVSWIHRSTPMSLVHFKQMIMTHDGLVGTSSVGKDVSIWTNRCKKSSHEIFSVLLVYFHWSLLPLQLGVVILLGRLSVTKPFAITNLGGDTSFVIDDSIHLKQHEHVVNNSSNFVPFWKQEAWKTTDVILLHNVWMQFSFIINLIKSH